MHRPAERAVARVDLGAIANNCRRLCSQLAAHSQLCAVVKADGYGHGALWSAQAALAGGATWLAVATAGEASELRRHGLSVPILVLGALTREDAALAATAGADVVVWTGGFAGDLASLARRQGSAIRCHVKLDTGMGRLGAVDPAQARSLCERIAADADLELAGVMTHFATADELDHGHFDDQLQAFESFCEEIRALHPGVVCHAANSAATLRCEASHFDLVRCGVAVYGLDPFQADPHARGLEPALSLESYVASIKRFEAGQSAGYGRRWFAPGPTWVGVVPIGYGDGWRRGLSNNAEVLVGGRRRPVVGTISMDNLTIDLGSETEAAVGDQAVLIGSQGPERILCEEVASRLDTINYEVTCALTPRVRRAVAG